MKTCLNCRYLAQNFSRLSEYHQSIADPKENYTCESGKGFTGTWLIGNPGGGSNCGTDYYQPKTSEQMKDHSATLREITKRAKAYGFQEDFDLDDEIENGDYSDISFSTRENGNMTNETYGRKDYKNAESLQDKIESDFPDVSCEIEPVDEWVMVYVKFKTTK